MPARFPRLALAAACFALATGAQAQTLDELHAAAKAGGALSIYAGGPTAPWEARARAFEQRFPGIKVSVTGGFSNVLNSRIEKQLADGKLEVDAGMFQTLQDFVSWKSRGHLSTAKPAGFDALDGSFKDAYGAFYAMYVNAMPYMFNRQRVKPEDVPNSALDFLKPQFAGKSITPYPADDDATLWLFFKIVQKYGWDYMDKYMATRPNFIQGHLPQQRSIATGQNWVTFDSIFSITGRLKQDGAPVDSHFSTVDPTPIWPLMGAVFKNAPHPNAARLFMSFMLEPAQQARTGSWSARPDVAPPAGFKPILSYTVVNDYLQFLVNGAQLVDLRKRFERYTGPVVNTGGVR